MQPKIYLAGPEVFLPNAVERADEQRRLCEKYGFVPLHPMDNNIDLGDFDYKTAVQIYKGDISQVRGADIILANCNPFRGICIDDGTAYELGFGNALGKASYGYTSERVSLSTRTIRDLVTTPHPSKSEQYVDDDGYMVTPDFGTKINLMMQCGITESSGRLIIGNFTDCLLAIRNDLDSGALTLKQA